MTVRTFADFHRAYCVIGPRLEELQRASRAARTAKEREEAERLMDVVIARWRMPAPHRTLRRRAP